MKDGGERPDDSENSAEGGQNRRAVFQRRCRKMGCGACKASSESNETDRIIPVLS